jgi:hypothetical protein
MSSIHREGCPGMLNGQCQGCWPPEPMPALTPIGWLTAHPSVNWLESQLQVERAAHAATKAQLTAARETIAKKTHKAYDRAAAEADTEVKP